jgi:serine/threonine protein kinase
MQAQFLDTQELVFTKGFRLESDGEKPHAHFGTNETLPFKVQEPLGQGAYAQVHKIVSMTSQRTYARKMFRRGNTKFDKHEMRSFMTELQILKRLHHHHCVELVNFRIKWHDTADGETRSQATLIKGISL